MTPIPRNQLLQKLVDGWKVRRRGWAKDVFLSKAENVYLSSLLEDDWEGEPPGPQLKHQCLNIIVAFEALKRGDAAFVRREAWEEGLCCKKMFSLSTEDVLAKDWEVWK